MRNKLKRRNHILSLLLAMVMFATAFQGSFPKSLAASEDVCVTNLQVEYVKNPMGIDIEKPRFSWTLESNLRGVKQTGYRILVAESEDTLATGPYVWDSADLGQGSDNTIGIQYGGPVLKPTTRYYWTVDVQTNKGEAVCDTGAFWETGFFDTTMDAWDGAQWISKPEYTVPEWKDTYSYTIEYDFRLTPDSEGFGFIFGSNRSGLDHYSLMWQLSADNNGVRLRPHRYNPDGAMMQDIDVSSVIPNTPEGKAAWYTMKIVVTGGSDPGYASITTYLGPAEAAGLTEVDTNRAITGGNSFAWSLGKIGFHMNANEEVCFTNIRVWDNTTVPSANNSTANRVFFEDFSGGASAMFPGLIPEEESGRSYIRVNNGKFTGSFASVHSAGVFGTNSENASNLLVDDQSSKWCQNANMNTAWFIMDAGMPVYAKSYALRGGNDDTSYTSRRLHTWTVQGSNSESGPWTTISSPGAQGAGWSGNYHLRTFDFDDEVYSQGSPYRYYRLQILRSGSSADGTALGTGNTLMQFSYFGLVGVNSSLGSLDVMYPTEPLGLGNEPLYRKEFTTRNRKIESARLYATAKGYYEFSLNGKKVGDQYLAPGWSDYFYTIMYQTYDVTDMLNENGSNVIGGMTGKGWYSGPHQMMGGGTGAYNMYGNTQSLLGKLVIRYEGEKEPDIIVTDDTWRFNYGPVTYDDNYRGEGYDARVDHEGWNNVGYDAGDWAEPLIVPFGPTLSSINRENPQIIGQVEPPIREVGRFTPIEVTPKAYPERLTYNLGQNIAGFISLRVKGKPGDKITIKHAEVLNTPYAYREGGVTRGGGDGPIGTIYRANLRDQYTAGPVAVDTYILKGDPAGEEWTPRFTFHGFQYFEITGDNFDITDTDRFEILELEGIAISSDNEMLSSFKTSHEKVNKLYSNIIWGMLGNQVGVPTDCPNRDERLGYTGDTEIFSRTATYLQNTYQFYTRWLRDLRDYQSSQTGSRTGVVPMLIPNNPRTNNFSNQWGNGWGDAATIVPWNMYQQYGDPQIIYDSYDSMKAWCDFLYNNTSATTYLRVTSSGTREWVLGDWLAYPDDLPSDYQRLTNTIFTAHSHSLFAKMARAIGDPNGEAGIYETRTKNIVNGIKAQYLTEDGRLVHTGGSTQEKQTAYAMMISFGLDKENNGRYAKRLSELIYANDGRLSTGFAGVASLNPALSNNGYTATAYTLLEQENYPSWLYPINQGATTAWERWNSYTTDNGYGNQAGMNSFNHYSFGSVGEWLMSGILGIERDESDPAAAGFRRFILNPQYGGTLTYAKGHYDSMSGKIESDWTIDIDTSTFTYDCTIPANTTATVYLPAKNASDVADVTEGGLPLAQAEGVTVAGYDADGRRLKLEVVSGSYSFASTAQVYFTNSINITSETTDAFAKIAADFTDGSESRTLTVPGALSLVRGEGVDLTVTPYNDVDFAFDKWIITGEHTGTLNGNVLSLPRLTENLDVKADFRWVGFSNILAGTPNSRIAVTRAHSETSTDWGKQNLVDGRLTQRDGRNGYTTAILSEYPTDTNISHITFDAGEGNSYPFNRIQIYPRTDAVNVSGGVAGFPRDFTIQGSDDNSTWTTIKSVTDCTTSLYKPYLIQLDETHRYRYLRLDCTRIGPAASDDGGGANYRMQITEFGAYSVQNVTVKGGVISDGGDYDGKSVGTYDGGAAVTVTGGNPNEGYVFEHWEAEGITLTQEQAINPSLTFTMPDNEVVLIAVLSTPADNPGVSVSTPTLVATCAANLMVSVEDDFGKALTAYLMINGEEQYPTILTNKNGTMRIDKDVLETGAYDLVVKGDGVYGSHEITVKEYNANIWEANAYVLDGKLLVQFNDDVSLKSEAGCVSIGGGMYNAKVLEDKRMIEVDAALPASGTAVSIKGVKYPGLFPSYSFTFTVTVP